MINFKILGCGAAGNKAVIQAFNDGVITENEFMLINSTDKDIPEEFKKYSYIYKDADGAGKERALGKQFAINALKTSDLNINEFTKNAKVVVLVSSLDGGTGTSSVSILAKFIKEVIGKHVYIIGFNGFENDARSLSNSIEYMKELEESYTISIISNKKCLDNNKSTNYRKAELIANDEFVKYIKSIKTIGVVPSSINIDGAELFKTISTPGYMIIERGSIADIKNTSEFNDIIKYLHDNSKSIDTEPTCKRMSIFILANNRIQNNVDYSFEEAKSNWGTPFELYQHVQESDDDEVVIISSGMNLPIKYFENLYSKYQEESAKVNKGADSFFNTISNFNGNEHDSEFNSLTNNVNNTKSADDFFNSLEGNKITKEEF